MKQQPFHGLASWVNVQSGWLWYWLLVYACSNMETQPCASTLATTHNSTAVAVSFSIDKRRHDRVSQLLTVVDQHVFVRVHVGMKVIGADTLIFRV